MSPPWQTKKMWNRNESMERRLSDRRVRGKKARKGVKTEQKWAEMKKEDKWTIESLYMTLLSTLSMGDNNDIDFLIRCLCP